jgi:hypothetical protein
MSSYANGERFHAFAGWCENFVRDSILRAASGQPKLATNVIASLKSGI